MSTKFMLCCREYKLLQPLAGWAFNALRDAVRIMVICCTVVVVSLEELQSNPFIVLYSEPTSPLTHSGTGIKKIVINR